MHVQSTGTLAFEHLQMQRGPGQYPPLSFSLASGEREGGRERERGRGRKGGREREAGGDTREGE